MKTVCLPLSEYIEKFRDKERFFELCKACKNFNNLWSCPPYNFDEDKIFAPFNYIYIFASKISTKENLRDYRTKQDKKLLELELKNKGSLAFFAGSCIVCDSCSKLNNEACTKPNSMRYSLESQGFDLCKTSKELFDIEIKWSTKDSQPEYYTLLSALCTEKKIDV